MERLIRANLHFLQQAETLLERLEDRQYREPVATFYGSSVGGHLRHCLEHYCSLLAGLGDGRVDYDDRRRDERLETKTAEAREALGRVRAQLESCLLYTSDAADDSKRE